MTTAGSGRSIIIMGISGCGKSSVGEALARVIGAKFIDGDDLHPKANIIKMAAGNPLNDADRAPWLERIRDAAFSIEQKNETGVIVCSALKKRYRDIIREGNNHLLFLHLCGSFELVLERMKARKTHFMPVELLQSQFDALEEPLASETDIKKIDIDGTLEEVLERCVAAVR